MTNGSRTNIIRLSNYALWIGVSIFFIAIAVAIGLYPGGNRFDARTLHYSFSGNFLCDLFAAKAYNGLQNPGRVFAILGTYSLAIGLLAFWQLLPRLFASQPKYQRVTKYLGTTAMLLSLLIATRLHDLCILIAAPLGFIAMIAATRALAKNGERLLARLGTIGIITCVVNYLAFAFRKFPEALPSLQKAALITFLIWILAAMFKIRPAIARILESRPLLRVGLNQYHEQ